MTDFAELQARAHATADEKGFQRHKLATDAETQNNYIGMKLMLVVGEVGEALEEIRSGHAPTEVYESWDPVPASLAAEFTSGAEATEHWRSLKPGKPEGFPIELADAVIRIMALAGELGIDLNEAIQIKQAYNEGRPHGHGRKF